MSAAGASLIGAAILAFAALFMSLRGGKSHHAKTSGFGDEIMKMAVAGGLATGACLLLVSVARLAQIAPSGLELLSLLAVPAVLVWRRRQRRGQRQTPLRFVRQPAGKSTSAA